MAVALTNDQVRRGVLQILYDDYNRIPEGRGVERNFLMEQLQVPERQLLACVYYLKEKNLLRLLDPHFIKDNPEWFTSTAKITALGIDVVEHKDQFAKEFPFLNVVIENVSGTLQNIGGSVYGPATVVQGDSNVLSVSQQIKDVFQQAYDKVKDAALPPEQKEEINGQLKDLEQEVQKEEKADVGKIQKISKWLRDNASWITPIISDVIKKVLEKAVGI